MRLLAFDTAASACSAALWAEGRLVARRFEPMERGHAEALLPMIERVLAEAGCAYAQIEAIAVTVGPGTFTGLRVGLAAARGLALALGCPVIPLGTLELLAAATTPRERTGRTVIACLGAGRGELYWQGFDETLAALAPPALARADLPSPSPAVAAAATAGAPGLPAGPLLLVGSGAGALRAALRAGGREAALSAAPPQPDAAHGAALAAGRRGVARPGPEVHALYLRGSGAAPREAV